MLRHLLNTCIALTVSVSLGIAINHFLPVSPLIGILVSTITSVVLIIGFKNTFTKELRSLIGVLSIKGKSTA
jgi:hypothetical protein